LGGETPPGGGRAQLALWLPATPVVKEPLTQDAGFVEAKFTEQFS
jgi:hypothetical protein